MKLYLLENYIERISYNNWWNLGSYRIPLKIRDNLDLQELRNNALQTNTSPYQTNWENFISSLLNASPKKDVLSNIKYGIFSYIREFPLLIDKPSLWEECLSRFGILDETRRNGKLFKETIYFLADYFFPKTGIIVEIDSGYHLGEKESAYDKARDLYIRLRYNIRVLRTFKFDIKNSKEFTKDFLKASNEYVKCKSRLGSPKDSDFPIDFMYYPVSKWIYEHSSTYRIFTYLEDRFPYLGNIEVTEEDLKKDVYIAAEIDDIFCDILCHMFSQVYLGSTLKIKRESQKP